MGQRSEAGGLACCLLVVVLVYGVLFMDWGGFYDGVDFPERDDKPFAGVCAVFSASFAHHYANNF